MTVTFDENVHSARVQLGVLKGATSDAVMASFDNVLFVEE